MDESIAGESVCVSLRGFSSLRQSLRVWALRKTTNWNNFLFFAHLLTLFDQRAKPRPGERPGNGMTWTKHRQKRTEKRTETKESHKALQSWKHWTSWHTELKWPLIRPLHGCEISEGQCKQETCLKRFVTISTETAGEVWSVKLSFFSE